MNEVRGDIDGKTLYLENFLQNGLTLKNFDVLWTELDEGVYPEKCYFDFPYLQVVFWGSVAANFRGNFEVLALKDFKIHLLRWLNNTASAIDDSKKFMHWYRSLNDRKPHFSLNLDTVKFDMKSSAHHFIPKDSIDYNQYFFVDTVKGKEYLIRDNQHLLPLINTKINLIIDELVEEFTSREEVQILVQGHLNGPDGSEDLGIEVENKDSETFQYQLSSNGWLDDLYDFLKNKERLISSETTKSQFKSIFGISPNFRKVDWTGSMASLNCLVRNFPASFLDEQGRHFKIAASCFLHKGEKIDAVKIRNNRWAKSSAAYKRMYDVISGLNNTYIHIL